MDKKQILVTGVFTGVFLYMAPRFFDIGWGAILFKIGGVLAMAAAVIWFIAGDVFTGSNKQSKEIKRKLKSGELTPAQAYKLESQALDLELAKVKMQHKIETKKAEIKKLKQPVVNPKAAGGSKMPQVLDNLGGLMSSQSVQQPARKGQQPQQQPGMFDNLSSLVGGSAPQQPQQAKKKKKKKNKKPIRRVETWY